MTIEPGVQELLDALATGITSELMEVFTTQLTKVANSNPMDTRGFGINTIREITSMESKSGFPILKVFGVFRHLRICFNAEGVHTEVWSMDADYRAKKLSEHDCSYNDPKFRPEYFLDLLAGRY